MVQNRAIQNGHYKRVRALTRGLDILAALNTAGRATVVELSSLTKIHRATVQRLVETLREQGYVRRSVSDNTYRLALRVRTLSDGYNDEAWISEVASPVLQALSTDIPWPVDLHTLDGDCMQVRESTHRFSPLSIHQNIVGRRFPMLETASGQAHLTFCPEAEREELRRVLKLSTHPTNHLARSAKKVDSILQNTRKKGYAVSIKAPAIRVTELSAPIRINSRVLGCLSLIFFTATYKPEEAASEYLPRMQAAIKQIEGSLATNAYKRLYTNDA